MEKRKRIEIDLEEAREMTEAEVESIASLFFIWWRREFEQKNNKENQSKRESDD